MSCPIRISELSLSFPQKICFEGFSTHIFPGDRIGIIGRNGSGKSSLLKLLSGQLIPTSGSIDFPSGMRIAHVPQLPEMDNALSGGERFQSALTAALAEFPDVLLLDEPTNHLDEGNRRSLFRLLQHFEGTLIVVTHDPEFLRACIQTLWSIDHENISIFKGNYDDYRREIEITRKSLESELSGIRKQQKDAHESLMKEQQRASQSRAKGEKSIQQKKWPTVVSQAKARRGEETSGRKQKAISDHRSALMEKLQNLPRYEEIIPTFSLKSGRCSSENILQIYEGKVAYGEKIVLDGVNFSMQSNDRIAISGENGSGKSTLLKAILNISGVARFGSWLSPAREDIGYLDQHYAMLDPSQTVFDWMASHRPDWSMMEIRSHLNTFLFRKNEAVNAKIETLSGSERARLCLAQIAAKTPELLILDEVTNNLDLETREHMIQVLNAYPGALLIISHDNDFLRAISATALPLRSLMHPKECS